MPPPCRQLQLQCNLHRHSTVENIMRMHVDRWPQTSEQWQHAHAHARLGGRHCKPEQGTMRSSSRTGQQAHKRSTWHRTEAWRGKMDGQASGNLINSWQLHHWQHHMHRCEFECAAASLAADPNVLPPFGSKCRPPALRSPAGNIRISCIYGSACCTPHSSCQSIDATVTRSTAAAASRMHRPRAWQAG